MSMDMELCLACLSETHNKKVYDMKRFPSMFRRMKIKSQIHYSMLLITVLSSLILGVVAYQVSKFIIERNYKEAYTYNLEVASSIVDIQLEKIIDAAKGFSFR
jgi:hypothetical protein